MDILVNLLLYARAFLRKREQTNDHVKRWRNRRPADYRSFRPRWQSSTQSLLRRSKMRRGEFFDLRLPARSTRSGRDAPRERDIVMCVYIYIYICLHTHVYRYIYIYIRVYIYIYIYMISQRVTHFSYFKYVSFEHKQ